MKIKTEQSTSYDTLKTLDAYRASQRTPDETFSIDLGLATGEPYLVASIDHTYGVAVPVGADWLERFDRLPRKESLKLVSTSTFHRGEKDYLQVTLTDEKLLRTFGDFVDNLLEALGSDGESDPGAVTIQLLNESQRLFKAAGTAVPSNEAQVGLLLELEALLGLHERLGPDSLRRWTGPENDRHDFELSDCSVECKATLSRESLAITIHGAHQLAPMGEKPLILLTRRYERTLDGGTSVPDTVRAISGLDGIDTDELVRKLAEAGLSPEVLEKDTEFTRFRAVDTYEFDVTADFPQIDPSTLSDRIGHVAYTIDLRDPSSVVGFRADQQILEKK